MNVKAKEQSKQWLYTHPPKKPKEYKQIPSRKLIAIAFWDRTRKEK
jgi:hypothetical protein